MENVGGQYLLVPIGAQVMDMNGIITLNATGAFLWELLEQDCTTDELAVAVSERFDVNPEAAKVDVDAFLREIAKLGMLTG